MRAASIGECMVEFHRRPDGSYGRGFGGDTLNWPSTWRGSASPPTMSPCWATTR